MTAATNVIAVAAGVALFAESFGSQPGVAWLHLFAMLAIAGASWRLVAVQARIGERERPAAPYPRRRRPARGRRLMNGQMSAGVCEDDHELRGVVRDALAREGFAVRATASGTEAVRSFANDPPDVLVLDVGLPDADGRDVCQALRARGVRAPVLFLSARDGVADRLSGFHAGGDDYLTKPFALAELLVRVHALRAARGARRRRRSPGPGPRPGRARDRQRRRRRPADADRVPPAGGARGAARAARAPRPP